MRLTVVSDKSKIQETKEFAYWLLDLGEGKLGGQNDGDTTFDIPDDLLIKDTKTMKIQISLVNEPYSPTNEVVEEVNDRLLSMFLGEEKEYLSSDSICPDENVRDTLKENMYSPNVLNGLKSSRMSNHKLVLKVGVRIMLLRNVYQKNEYALIDREYEAENRTRRNREEKGCRNETSTIQRIVQAICRPSV
ncbi:uncharacterized protein LOC143609836 [Bidens hawaiensis]|uniref:uncharacterized protein LOC143609836 n=1 Tax=Bidens hawaiensis TaxID=980011 RepID=UPI004049C94E